MIADLWSVEESVSDGDNRSMTQGEIGDDNGNGGDAKYGEEEAKGLGH